MKKVERDHMKEHMQEHLHLTLMKTTQLENIIQVKFCLENKTFYKLE